MILLSTIIRYDPLMPVYFIICFSHTNIIKTKKLDRVLLTHFHEDHSGNAAEIKKSLNIWKILKEGSINSTNKVII